MPQSWIYGDTAREELKAAPPADEGARERFAEQNADKLLQEAGGLLRKPRGAPLLRSFAPPSHHSFFTNRTGIFQVNVVKMKRL